MQVFTCPDCDTTVYFHNRTCARDHAVRFDPEAQTMRTDVQPCANREDIGCNWMAETDGLCRACAMTEIVPDLREADNLPLWERTELAKRWMLANLGRWGWFGEADTGERPVFRLLSEHTAAGDAKVVMGHANGVITINVSEASEAVRAKRQEQMGELYRTMIGHMRHEMAHFLHIRLSEREGFLDEFRKLFGDERADYGEALKAHYANPGVADENHITSYATAHPHEDWAETIAHLLHLVDFLDSASLTRLALPEGPMPGYDAYAENDTETLLKSAVALSMAVNHVNRALDLPDLYPFVLGKGVREKLAFAHRHMRSATGT